MRTHISDFNHFSMVVTVFLPPPFIGEFSEEYREQIYITATNCHEN